MSGIDETVDYVVVGAGSAGCVMANRLSANNDVLVLEAGGPDDQREISIPAAAADLMKSDVDWDYSTVPQSELEHRELYWPRGKALGGSSSINAMIHVRGHQEDYDTWAEQGNDEWAWDDVLPVFKRLEHDDYGGEYHGTGGPMHVHRPEPPELTAAWIDAAEAAGFEYNDDFNGATLDGVGTYPLSVKNGQRHSAAEAYLKPVLDRSTLQARTHAHVTSIRFDDHDAVGVEYEQDGRTFRVDAREEVIVCGGAINSPQLLLVSGIGPAEHLREHDIEVVQDLPGVGRNLQDHLAVGCAYEVTESVTLDEADTLVNVARWLVTKGGPLATNAAEGGAFFRSDDHRPAPDLQFHLVRAMFMRHGMDAPPDTNGFWVGPSLLTPESSGRIELRTDDSTVAPFIDPQYLTEGDDLERLVHGVRRSREVCEQTAMDRYRGREHWPGADATSDAELADFVRRRAQTIYHPVGTCKMGDDDLAVVDDRLRVHGVEGLRVIDASIMPTVPRGNTNIPTIMVAERAAEFVRN